MTPRRTALVLLLSPFLAAAPLHKLAGRWRSRLTTVRGGRAVYVRLRFLFAPDGALVLEEYAPAGPLAWVYKGAARFTPSEELYFDVQSVNDANGSAADGNAARYQPGESYNFGALEILSSARVRVGALELQKELE
jgi:hypothetical protein